MDEDKRRLSLDTHYIRIHMGFQEHCSKIIPFGARCAACRKYGSAPASRSNFETDGHEMSLEPHRTSNLKKIIKKYNKI